MDTFKPLVKLDFFEVDQGRWPDFEKLFESRGGPKNCWCMVWRGKPEDRKTKVTKKSVIRNMVQEHVPIGILGYAGDEPVAWCSIAPRSTYRDLGGIYATNENPDQVWSVVCFYVAREFRGHGVMKQLLQAAIEHARQRGAAVVEAYPVAPDSPSYRFMGFVPQFKEFGFVEVGTAGSRRHVMRFMLH
ncbi:GNAT family N-acetyltransferase [Paenibacillus elgii]|uniref:GNAT family N-acetyltransferase n=1 Tax=Paenibacillus elgii TaxID=189691 RepID=UPI00203C9E79|nr:GNAT family N-acetyltransferase [Paenibacillus elgii]MCM3271865.1 GNAT family N-acetyltransferase [Paenibacillus elgii]